MKIGWKASSLESAIAEFHAASLNGQNKKEVINARDGNTTKGS